MWRGLTFGKREVGGRRGKRGHQHEDHVAVIRKSYFIPSD